jgi:hypothetical protein
LAAVGTGIAEATSAVSPTEAQHGPDSSEWGADFSASCSTAANGADCDAADGRSYASQIGRASTKESATSASATKLRRAAFRLVRERIPLLTRR